MASRLDGLTQRLLDANTHNGNDSSDFAVPSIQSAHDLHLFNQFLGQLSVACGYPIDASNLFDTARAEATRATPSSSTTNTMNTMNTTNATSRMSTTNTANTTTTTTTTTTDLFSNVAFDLPTNDVVYPDLSGILPDLVTDDSHNTSLSGTGLGVASQPLAGLLTNPLASIESINSVTDDNHHNHHAQHHSHSHNHNHDHVQQHHNHNPNHNHNHNDNPYLDPHDTYANNINSSPYPDLKRVLSSALQQRALNSGRNNRVQEAKRVPNHVANEDELLRQVLLLSFPQKREPSDDNGVVPSKETKDDDDDDEIDINQLSEKLASLGLQRKPSTHVEQGRDGGINNGDSDDDRGCNDGCCNTRQRHAKLVHMLHAKVNQAFRCQFGRPRLGDDDADDGVSGDAGVSPS